MSNPESREGQIVNQDYQVLLVSENDQDAKLLEQTLSADTRGNFLPLTFCTS